MNLLLLLSALLSALGGAGGVRATPAPVALSRSVAQAAQASAAARAQVAARPAQPIAGPAQAVMALPEALGLHAAIPAFASRRRE
ncbi:MAG: hypothetical protein J0I47_04945 [Sphingomonas sp.]|uniref:hypothetical protein n=1 Tax=Sphingomonas sp. TaxID=28214 RepID=UPI001AD27F3E|nr:hypothetical protein [Sphingomonas sp.]MBN8807571.1 hypothetical protein [Sphingomonas sp.]